ncbi:MAG: leucyl aminopeptidase [Candidatus Rokubacteria bacterium]|nr:leucyl aminopeptidase [Candidatus Rokubacteria bacterium]
MRLTFHARSLLQADGDVLVVGGYAEEKRLAPPMAALDRALKGLLSEVLRAEKFTGKPEQIAYVHTAGRLPAKRVLVVGLGKRKELDAERVRRATAAALRRARDLGARIVSAALLGDGLAPKVRAQALAEGALLGAYTFDRYKREKNDKAVEELRVVDPQRRLEALIKEGLSLGELFADAACFARDLVNEPANQLTPTYLAKVATQIAKDGKLKLKIYDRGDCQKLGMGAYLGVAQGSEEPPKFIHLTYAPRGRGRRKIAIVGKGITFDSGGLDLKTADGMLRMKDDMSGPSGTAQRPGDIVRAMNGATIEIGNTDAEGRLTLADALAYAVKEVKPQEVIDLATLTGAIVVALGNLCSGVMWNDRPLADRVLAAAEAAGERMWPMPLIDEYKELLKSDVADLNNVGPRGGGALTAGIFLREFAGSVPWVHLDIAGTAFTEKDLPLGPKGGTGVGVRTVLTYLMTQAGSR